MEIIVWIIAFAVTITVHEASHAWMADRLGDPTARVEGRLSLNPLKHYDPIGTTLLLVLVVARAFGIPVIPFGWAKPVPVDPYNFKNPQRDSALVSLAGPGSNLILATVLSVIIRFFPSNLLLVLFFPVILLNVSLAIFNLIPVNPLDGGHILLGLLPKKDARVFEIFLSRYGMFILFFLIVPIGGSSLISSVITPVIRFVVSVLLPGSILI
jgi:Zn-dependent protease